LRDQAVDGRGFPFDQSQPDRRRAAARRVRDELMAKAPQLPPLVERTVQRMIRAFAPEQILLFGSQAKRQAGEHTDFDLLIVAALEGGRGAHERRARQLAADCFPPVDVVFATPADLTEAAEAKSPFLLSILGSGIVLYHR